MPTIPPPDRDTLLALIGAPLYALFTKTCERIEALYDTDRL